MREQVIHNEGMPDVNSEMELRLLRALEARPAVRIPPDFAAQVLRQLPAQRPIVLTPTHYGRNVMMSCIVVLGIAFVVALTLHGIVIPRVVQVTGWLLYAQFLGLVLWLGLRGELRRLG